MLDLLNSIVLFNSYKRHGCRMWLEYLHHKQRMAYSCRNLFSALLKSFLLFHRKIITSPQTCSSSNLFIAFLPSHAEGKAEDPRGRVNGGGRE